MSEVTKSISLRLRDWWTVWYLSSIHNQIPPIPNITSRLVGLWLQSKACGSDSGTYNILKLTRCYLQFFLVSWKLIRKNKAINANSLTFPLKVDEKGWGKKVDSFSSSNLQYFLRVWRRHHWHDSASNNLDLCWVPEVTFRSHLTMSWKAYPLWFPETHYFWRRV